MVTRFPLVFAALAVIASAGCDKKAAEPAPQAAKPSASAAAEPPGADTERAARTPTARRMPLSEPMTRCDAAGTWKLQVTWRRDAGNRACKGAPLDRSSFEFEVADQDGEFEATPGWKNYASSALEVTVDGADCLLDFQLESQRISGAGLIFNLSEKDGTITGEGMYEAPVDLDSGETCLREFDVTGTLARPATP